MVSLRLFFRSYAVANLKYLRKTRFLYACAQSSELPYDTMTRDRPPRHCSVYFVHGSFLRVSVPRTRSHVSPKVLHSMLKSLLLNLSLSLLNLKSLLPNLKSLLLNLKSLLLNLKSSLPNLKSLLSNLKSLYINLKSLLLNLKSW